MSILKSLAIAFCFTLACMVLAPAAGADQWNEETKLHFDEPVEIPGVVLPAGTYWFVLWNDPGTRDVLRIFGANKTTLYANLVTTPTVREQSSARTEIVFAERHHSQPPALWKWYYPGDLTGHEFIYSTTEEKRLNRDPKQVVKVLPTSTAQNTTVAGE